MKNGTFKIKYVFLVLAAAAALMALLTTTASCKYSLPDNNTPVEYSIEVENEQELEQLLNNTFRIDIGQINVVFDYYPDARFLECRAVVDFVMRPGQTRPVIHLEPGIREWNAVRSIRLDNESLEPLDPSDVRLLEYEDSTQKALEFQRDLAPGTAHRLEIEYVIRFTSLYPRFSTEVNDLEGKGNEELFPTLNTPGEMARHYLTFRVHGDTPYRCIGSGLVLRVTPAEGEENIQQWTLDTEREIPSFMVMFVLMPSEDTALEERRIAGVDVRVMAFQGGESPAAAFAELEEWIPILINDFGSFPMPHGLSVFLTNTGGGMEYYGGTITSLRALRHEVFHMYFACSTVNKTYRDLWMDEAINMWYGYSMNPAYAAIAGTYRSNMVSGRSPVAVGCDRRAYDDGAQVIQAVALRLGGRSEMISFLSHLHANYSFAPFTTMEFLDYLRDYAGVDMEDEFLQWLYSNEVSTASASLESSETPIETSKANLTPPEHLLRKYIHE